MQNESWMQPALITSEAVLLPALERRSSLMPRFGNRYFTSPPSEDVFRPAEENWGVPPSRALSTYVRPRGSMAGRSVLRAAGVRTVPMQQKRAYSAGTLCRSCRVSKGFRK